MISGVYLDKNKHLKLKWKEKSPKNGFCVLNSNYLQYFTHQRSKTRRRSGWKKLSAEGAESPVGSAGWKAKSGWIDRSFVLDRADFLVVAGARAGSRFGREMKEEEVGRRSCLVMFKGIVKIALFYPIFFQICYFLSQAPKFSKFLHKTPNA